MKLDVTNKIRFLKNSIFEMRVSLQIIVLMFFLLFVVISSSFLVINQLNIFNHDASAINNLGVIRGLIQRVSKHQVSNIPSINLIHKVDKTFESVKSTYFLRDDNLSYLKSVGAHEKLESLELAWSDLKKHFANERLNKADDQQLLHASELCWELANDLVYSVQTISERKLKNYRRLIFYILFVVSFFIFGVIILVHKIVHKSLEFDVITDPMTKLYNRMNFSKDLHEQITLANRYEYIFSLILFDLDYFKNINDDFGHQSGDKVLILFSDILKENSRDVDLVFRLGGEEFGIIAPETDLKHATQIAEKYRLLVSQSSFEVDRQITVSIGVSQFVKNEDSESFFKRTDDALYEAKSSGRNKVMISHEKADFKS